MTQQEMEIIISELRVTFDMPVNPKSWTTDGLAFDRYENTWANSTTREFETTFGVGLWFGGHIATTITSVDQWNAFKSVACLFSQNDDTHYGECVYCHRLSTLNRFNSCEACELEARIDNR